MLICSHFVYLREFWIKINRYSQIYKLVVVLFRFTLFLGRDSSLKVQSSKFARKPT